MSESVTQLEQTLRDLPRIGTRLDTDANDDVERWRFEASGKPYQLRFFPRSDPRPMRDFLNLQRLQKAGVSSPHVHGLLKGFRLGDRVGDALLLESIEPSHSLRDLMLWHHLDGTPIAGRTAVRRGVAEILRTMGLSKLRHPSLTLSSFRVRASDHRVFLDDWGIRSGEITSRDLMHLAHDARGLLNASDLLRIWTALDQRSHSLPDQNLLSRKLWRAFDRTTLRDGEHVGSLSSGEWTGVFTRRAPRPVRWSRASKRTFTREQWLIAWPALLDQIERDALPIIKRDASGDVLRGSITLGDETFDVIVKRPRRTRRDQHVIDLFRHARAARGWVKSWKMLIRSVPTEWPMLLMEERTFGGLVVRDAIAVYELVPDGTTLAAFDFDTISNRDARGKLFRRAGAILRQIDDAGFTHYDAKSTNWIIFPDPVDGPRPILIDVDGVRTLGAPITGFNRLMRALRQHPKFTPEDSRNFCLGYAPEATPIEEPLPAKTP